MCGQGDLIWMHHREVDKEWNLLLKGLWRYQWNRVYRVDFRIKESNV